MKEFPKYIDDVGVSEHVGYDVGEIYNELAPHKGQLHSLMWVCMYVL